jgi:hypothetical protein
MRPWRRAIALTVGVCVSMSACGVSSGVSSDEAGKREPSVRGTVPAETPSVGGPPRSDQPAETPNVGGPPRSGPPAGMRRANGKFFSMDVPANFREMAPPMNDGNELVAFHAPSSRPGNVVQVVVGADTKPKGTVLEQSRRLEAEMKRDESRGIADFTRSTVGWPGAESAILFQWTEKRGDPGGPPQMPQRNWQLSAQVNEHLIVEVIAFAPAGEFDRAGLAKIVETFRPHA